MQFLYEKTISRLKFEKGRVMRHLKLTWAIATFQEFFRWSFWNQWIEMSYIIEEAGRACLLAWRWADSFCWQNVWIFIKKKYVGLHYIERTTVTVLFVSLENVRETWKCYSNQRIVWFARWQHYDNYYFLEFLPGISVFWYHSRVDLLLPIDRRFE